MAHEFEVRGQSYRAEKMPGRTQTHVFRRMAPIVGRLIQVAQGGDQAESILQLAMAISGLEDGAVDYILDNCLRTVERRQGDAQKGIWSKVKPGDMQGTMFSDIEMDDELEIVGNVVHLNFWPILKKNLGRIKVDIPSALSI